MSEPGDIGGEVSGDEAAWRDLIARFDVPMDRTTTVVPWPAREDLPESASPARPPGNLAEPQPDRSAPADSPAELRGRTAEATDPIADAPGGTCAQPGATADVSGPPADPSSWATDPAAGIADPSGGSDQAARPATSFAIPVDRTRVIRSAGAPRSYTPPEEDDEPYVPAPLSPPAGLDSISKAALAGVIGGPGYLLVASIFLHWTISAEAALIAVAAFVGGFVTLVVKLGDRPSRDDDDDGAVL
jgi:hypothetical protein